MSQEGAEAATAPQTTDDAAQASYLTADNATEASSHNASDAVEADALSTDGADSTDTASESEPDSAEESEPGDELTAWKQYARKYEHRTEKAESAARKMQRELKQLRSKQDELQEQIANQDAEIVGYQQGVAREKLATQLARNGMSAQNVSTVLEHIDPMRLLSEGTPSEEAITQVAGSLAASTHRGEADVDQGRRSDVDGLSADAWLRKQARPH